MLYRDKIKIDGTERTAIGWPAGYVQQDDEGRAWVTGFNEEQRWVWGSPPAVTVDMQGGTAGSADGPGQYVRVTHHAPATDTGQVDFREMLEESWQPQARDRLNAVLGRPYLATQLAHYLPADVAHRLVDRLEGLVEREVQREVDRIHADVNEATRQTLARLAADADRKLEELRRERFNTPSRLD